MREHKILIGKEMILRLHDLGIIDKDVTGRVVIDIKPGDVVMIYVQQFGDERLLDVVQTLDGIKVVHKDA